MRCLHTICHFSPRARNYGQKITVKFLTRNVKCLETAESLKPTMSLKIFFSWHLSEEIVVRIISQKLFKIGNYLHLSQISYQNYPGLCWRKLLHAS